MLTGFFPVEKKKQTKMTDYKDNLQKHNKDEGHFFHETKWTMHKRPQLVESSVFDRAEELPPL